MQILHSQFTSLSVGSLTATDEIGLKPLLYPRVDITYVG